MRRSITTVALATLLVSGLQGPLARTARADESDEAEITKMAKEHYKAGLDAYKAGKYDVAIKELKKAYLLKRLPALLLNIGATYRKMGDNELALHFYSKYLDEAPADAKDRGEVEQIVAELKQAGATGKGEGKTEPRPEPRAEREPREEERPARRTPPPSEDRSEDRTAMPREWSHTVVDAAPPDTPFDVKVSMPVMKGVKVYLYYRPPGLEKFESVLMKRRGPDKVGRIPADAMKGKSVQYYIEARDSGGSVVKAAGSQADPNIVMIDPSAPPQVLASLEESRQPREDFDRDRGRDEDRGRRSYDEEEERRPVRRKAAAGPSGPRSTLFWAGVGLLAGGAGAAIVGGGLLGGAKAKADDISYYSQNPRDNMGPIYFNNDPTSGSWLADTQAAGQGMNAGGIALAVVGGAAAVTGAVLLIVDQVVFKGQSQEREKPASKSKPQPNKRNIDDDMSWQLTPVLGPKVAGVSFGLTF